MLGVEVTRNVSAVYTNKCHEKDNFLNILHIFPQIFMRCDAEGYCYDYWPYMGKHDMFHGRSLGERVVKHLCRPLKYKGHHVFFDRFVMNTTIWLTKIEIYSFPEHFMLNVYVLHHISYFWHNFRFFTSISLVRTLLHNGIFSCGTIKCDSEGFPPELRNPDLRRGDTLQMQHDQLLATAWKDKKMVNISSKTMPHHNWYAQAKINSDNLT